MARVRPAVRRRRPGARRRSSDTAPRSRSRTRGSTRERSLIATTLQRSLLPPDLPEIPGFRLASLYQAAGEQNDVGGDFYDAFEVPGRVDGGRRRRGRPRRRGGGAHVAVALHAAHRRQAAGGSDRGARAAQRRAARAAGAVAGQRLLRAAALRRRARRRADLVLAGHPPAFHVRAGSSRPVGVFAPFLGAYERGGWEATTIRLEPADQLVLYTDGVIDTVGRGGSLRRGAPGARRCAMPPSAADAVGGSSRRWSNFAHGLAGRRHRGDRGRAVARRARRAVAKPGAMRLESLATRERSLR